jgi:hypothetical protein
LLDPKPEICRRSKELPHTGINKLLRLVWPEALPASY